MWRRVCPGGLHFDFDERASRDKRRDLHGASCGLVWLLRCSKVLRVRGIHAGEVELVLHCGIRRHVHAHHDDVAHPKALLFQECLNLGERTVGLRLRIPVHRRNAFLPIRRSHGRWLLPP